MLKTMTKMCKLDFRIDFSVIVQVSQGNRQVAAGVGVHLDTVLNVRKPVKTNKPFDTRERQQRIRQVGSVQGESKDFEPINYITFNVNGTKKIEVVIKQSLFISI